MAIPEWFTLARSGRAIMARSSPSGYHLSTGDIPVVLAMQNRGDRDHDIAAWFGVNQGRVADAKKGKWGKPKPAPAKDLPPKGAPGIKGRRLRDAVAVVAGILAATGADTGAKANAALKDAIASYDKNEA
ncbi:MAG TPA: hypothetical protein VHU23_11100 [Rhizomicrobium sp.]|nr:hypothetical protein [Rhizomicrobium sp.]